MTVSTLDNRWAHRLLWRPVRTSHTSLLILGTLNVQFKVKVVVVKKKEEFFQCITVEPLLTHTSPWMGQVMGQFSCKFGFCSSRKVWVMRVYGLREVWVKRRSTVVLSCFDVLVNESCTPQASPCTSIIRLSSAIIIKSLEPNQLIDTLGIFSGLCTIVTTIQSILPSPLHYGYGIRQLPVTIRFLTMWVSHLSDHIFTVMMMTSNLLVCCGA